MPMTEPGYFTAFKNFAFTRTPSGVLTLRFHTEGGPATFTGQMHTDFPRALYEIGEDRDNRVLVLTGTGDRFMTEIDGQSLDDPTKPAIWDKTTAEGRRIMQRLVDLEMPIVAAVNGPAAVHSEYVLIADIVIAAGTTVFSDFPHLTFGIVPGDGIYLAWEEAHRPQPGPLSHLDPGLVHRRAGRAVGCGRRGTSPGPGAAAGAGTRRGSRRQAAVADQVPGGHRAPAPQPPDGRGISARLGAGRPHRR